jgi:hypothetical protein
LRRPLLARHPSGSMGRLCGFVAWSSSRAHTMRVRGAWDVPAVALAVARDAGSSCSPGPPGRCRRATEERGTCGNMATQQGVVGCAVSAALSHAACIALRCRQGAAQSGLNTPTGGTANGEVANVAEAAPGAVKAHACHNQRACAQGSLGKMCACLGCRFKNARSILGREALAWCATKLSSDPCAETW